MRSEAGDFRPGEVTIAQKRCEDLLVVGDGWRDGQMDRFIDFFFFTFTANYLKKCSVCKEPSHVSVSE